MIFFSVCEREEGSTTQRRFLYVFFAEKTVIARELGREKKKGGMQEKKGKEIIKH